MKTLRDAWNWLAVEAHQRRGIRALEISIGLMLLFRVATEARFASYLWGPRGIGWGSTSHVLGPWLGALIDLPFTTEAGTAAVLLVLALAALALLCGLWTRPATALTFLAFFALEQRLPELADGGDNITQLVLIYMLFLLPAGARTRPGNLRVWIHNVAVLAIALQVVIMYATSGFMKAYGDHWHHGVAMYYISQVEWFSLPALRKLFLNPLATTMTTYAPMVYQIFFPLAVISPLKLPWLLLGAAFHLGVAVLMGLVPFSMVMVGLELFLISDREYARLGERLGSMWFPMPRRRDVISLLRPTALTMNPRAKNTSRTPRVRDERHGT